MTRGFDWKEQAEFRRSMRANQERNDIVRAKRRQAERAKSERLRAERDALLSTDLCGRPVPAPEAKERLRYKPMRWWSDRLWSPT